MHPFLLCQKQRLVGVTATVEMTEKATGEVQVFETYVMGNEMRSDGDVTLIIAPTTDWPLMDYDNGNAQTNTFKIVLSREPLKNQDVSKF